MLSKMQHYAYYGYFTAIAIIVKELSGAFPVNNRSEIHSLTKSKYNFLVVYHTLPTKCFPQILKYSGLQILSNSHITDGIDGQKLILLSNL